MFELFTDRARQVVVLAQEEARALKHDHIGTEHILLGLLRDEGRAAGVLESFGVTLVPTRELVKSMFGGGETDAPGMIPFTRRAQHALEEAAQESLSLNYESVGAEHILLSLTREEGVAAQLLVKLGADSEKIRNEVIRILPRPRGGRHTA